MILPANQNAKMVRTGIFSELKPTSGSEDLFTFWKPSTVTLAKQR